MMPWTACYRRSAGHRAQAAFDHPLLERPMMTPVSLGDCSTRSKKYEIETPRAVAMAQSSAGIGRTVPPSYDRSIRWLTRTARARSSRDMPSRLRRARIRAPAYTSVALAERWHTGILGFGSHAVSKSAHSNDNISRSSTGKGSRNRSA